MDTKGAQPGTRYRSHKERESGDACLASRECALSAPDARVWAPEERVVRVASARSVRAGQARRSAPSVRVGARGESASERAVPAGESGLSSRSASRGAEAVWARRRQAGAASRGYPKHRNANGNADLSVCHFKGHLATVAVSTSEQTCPNIFALTK